ncbi:glycosyltransferase family 2 protein [Pedobacter nyackensis]|uniref:Glycosyl transferase family 2 n=1 Tax=Pedobacter nyackensis TaxID=475255 RepID=A0A1W2BIU5_9SPHI|nr:glycosyltransferase family 2 protein [Pedobacter nyackensis]SMC72791.1 Glycosyl transferase family 2 [Pedobacter nyackensis]
MTQKALVSVIIPSYNYEQYLPYTLDCLINQSYQHIEVIVVDDGSKDNTRELMQHYLKMDSRILYFYQENKGLSSARNFGIHHSKGEYVQFLDADDLVSEHKLELQVEHLNNHPDLYISYTDGCYFADKKPSELFKTLLLTEEEWMPKLNGLHYEAIEVLVKRNIMPVNSALVKSTVFEKAGLFNENLRSLEDWDFWLRCAFANLKIQYLDDERAFALVRVHKNSMSQDRSKMYSYELELRLKIQDAIQESSALKAEQVEVLNKLNTRSMLGVLSLLIRSVGLFKVNNHLPLAKKTGVKIFIKSYLKALNDSRKS